MRKLPVLRTLQSFEAVAEHPSFSAAAESLGMTHGAVSHQMRSLERWLGKELFERHSGGVRLNEEGERLKRACARAFSILEEGCSQVREQAPVRKLTIGCSATFLARWLLPRVELFSRRSRAPMLVFQSRTDVNSVLTGKVDVLITSQSGRPSAHVRAVPRTADAIGPVCAPGWAEMPRKPGDVAKCPLLHATSRLDAWGEWGTAVNIPDDLSQGRRFDSLSLTIEAARAGLGLAMTPEFLVRGDVGNGRLAAPLGFVKVKRATWLYFDPDRQSDTELMSFVKWLVCETKRDIALGD